MAIVGETMKKTKVIATIGPATKDKEKIKELILNGMDVARINMSHANQEFLKYVVDTIDELNKELNTFVSTMLDTEGPSVRVGHLEGGHAYLTKGDKIRIYQEEVLGNSTKFSVHYDQLFGTQKHIVNVAVCLFKFACLIVFPHIRLDHADSRHVLLHAGI